MNILVSHGKSCSTPGVWGITNILIIMFVPIILCVFLQFLAWKEDKQNRKDHECHRCKGRKVLPFAYPKEMLCVLLLSIFCVPSYLILLSMACRFMFIPYKSLPFSFLDRPVGEMFPDCWFWKFEDEEY